MALSPRLVSTFYKIMFTLCRTWLGSFKIFLGTLPQGHDLPQTNNDLKYFVGNFTSKWTHSRGTLSHLKIDPPYTASLVKNKWSLELSFFLLLKLNVLVNGKSKHTVCLICLLPLFVQVHKVRILSHRSGSLRSRIASHICLQFH
jgi:hypothetical protein